MVQEKRNEFGLSNVRNQIFAALTGSYIIFCHGINVGWVSIAIPILLSDETPLVTGPLTYEELSWVGAISSIGAILGAFMTALVSAVYGSKRAIVFSAFPVIAFWIIIYFGNNFYLILLARTISGLVNGAFQSGIVLFISEISNNNIRGRLGSLVPLARNMGILTAFIAGALIKYKYWPYIFIAPPVSYLILVYFLPSTPQYYLKVNNFEEAEKSLMFYKGLSGKTDQEKFMLKAEFEQMKAVEEERKNSPKMQLKDLCNWSTIKGAMTCIAIAWFTQVTGFIVFMHFASLIFRTSGSIFSANVSAIILAVSQIVGGLTSTQVGDTFGRKTTLFISLLGSAVGLLAFSAYLYLHHHGYQLSNYMWLPVVSLAFVIFISAVGIVALANTCVVENFPTKIRPAGMIFFSLVSNSVIFALTKLFPILMQTIYLHGVIFLLAINCCFGLIFVFFMKETKGKSLDRIDTAQNN